MMIVHTPSGVVKVVPGAKVRTNSSGLPKTFRVNSVSATELSITPIIRGVLQFNDITIALKTCRCCGRVYTINAYRARPSRVQNDPNGVPAITLRFCLCGNTMAEEKESSK